MNDKQYIDDKLADLKLKENHFSEKEILKYVSKMNKNARHEITTPPIFIIDPEKALIQLVRKYRSNPYVLQYWREWLLEISIKKRNGIESDRVECLEKIASLIYLIEEIDKITYEELFKLTNSKNLNCIIF